MLERIIYTVSTAAESIAYNKLRALLTSLGIIFGVASVIAMLAIGRGAEEEILDQIQLLGVNNVIVTPVIEQEEGEVDAEDSPAAEKKPYSPGLTLHDAEAIMQIVPGVSGVSPEVVSETVAIRAGLRRSIRLVGVDGAYFADGGSRIASGNFFTDGQLREAAPVCILGASVRTRFFPKDEALGSSIKVGNLWLNVVGVLEERHVTSQALEHLGIRDYNLDIYTPIRTHLIRFENRAQLTARDIQQGEQDRRQGRETKSANYHQIDRLVVRTAGSAMVKPVADVVSRMLERRHNSVVDFQVTVPEVLLAQEQRTQTIFNIVLAAIASISLIVGGIGIMNIMLASVMERTREIGVRRSVGATRRDVVLQFLLEAVTISFSGGIIGILLGIFVSAAIEHSTGILTIVTLPAVSLSFLVSVGVGLVFGYLPARRAAKNDPVVSLRYE